MSFWCWMMVFSNGKQTGFKFFIKIFYIKFSWIWDWVGQNFCLPLFLFLLTYTLSMDTYGIQFWLIFISFLCVVGNSSLDLHITTISPVAETLSLFRPETLVQLRNDYKCHIQCVIFFVVVHNEKNGFLYKWNGTSRT